MSYGNMRFEGKKEFLGGHFTFNHLVVQLSVPLRVPQSILRLAYDSAYSSNLNIDFQTIQGHIAKCFHTKVEALKNNKGTV